MDRRQFLQYLVLGTALAVIPMPPLRAERPEKINLSNIVVRMDLWSKDIVDAYNKERVLAS